MLLLSERSGVVLGSVSNWVHKLGLPVRFVIRGKGGVEDIVRFLDG
jgi:hypothetical protein